MCVMSDSYQLKLILKRYFLVVHLRTSENSFDYHISLFCLIFFLFFERFPCDKKSFISNLQIWNSANIATVTEKKNKQINKKNYSYIYILYSSIGPAHEEMYAKESANRNTFWAQTHSSISHIRNDIC